MAARAGAAVSVESLCRKKSLASARVADHALYVLTIQRRWCAGEDEIGVIVPTAWSNGGKTLRAGDGECWSGRSKWLAGRVELRVAGKATVRETQVDIKTIRIIRIPFPTNFAAIG